MVAFFFWRSRNGWYMGASVDRLLGLVGADLQAWAFCYAQKV